MLRPGRYSFGGVNVDTLHLHEYRLDGHCTLIPDGTLSGTATETSAVWTRPVTYRLANGSWTASGHLAFYLDHSDFRGALFDPFLFHLDVMRVLPRATPRPRSPTPNAIGSAGRDEGAGRAESDSEEEEAWQAVGGWWQTAAGGAGASGADGAARRPGASRTAATGGSCAQMPVAGNGQEPSCPSAPSQALSKQLDAFGFAGSWGRIKHLRLVRQSRS